MGVLQTTVAASDAITAAASRITVTTPIARIPCFLNLRMRARQLVDHQIDGRPGLPRPQDFFNDTLRPRSVGFDVGKRLRGLRDRSDRRRNVAGRRLRLLELRAEDD